MEKKGHANTGTGISTGIVKAEKGMSNGDFIKDFKRSEEWDRAQILQFILWICFIQIFSDKNGAYGPFLGPFSRKHLISSPSPLSS